MDAPQEDGTRDAGRTGEPSGSGTTGGTGEPSASGETGGTGDTGEPSGTGEPTTYGEFPLKRFLGMEMSGDDAGRGRARLDVGAEHLNPNGVVHGAVLFAMVDTAMGKATMSVLDEGLFCASVEVSLRFIRPAASGTLTTEATVVRRGRSIVHLEARTTDDRDRLVATGAGTFAVITP